MLVGDELKVDGMDNGPDLPASLASAQQVVLELVTDSGKRVSVDETEVGEKDSHENGAPQDLVNSNLEGNILGASSLDLVVQPPVKVVARGSVREKYNVGKDRMSKTDYQQGGRGGARGGFNNCNNTTYPW